MVRHHFILVPKMVKFLKVGKFGADFRLSKKLLFSITKFQFKNISLCVTLSQPYQPANDIQSGVEINLSRFHVCTTIIFGGVRARTDGIELYGID